MFRIRFQGLVTHADVNGQVAIFYNEQLHRAIVTINDADWISGQTTLPVAGTGPGVTCFRLKGRMWLQGLEAGPVQKYLNGVPKLVDICDGKTVRSEIMYRRPHADFRAYLDLDGGGLTIEDWFEFNGTFDTVSLRCIPRAVIYGASATDSTVRLFMENSGAYITLQPHAELTMTNLDISGGPAANEYQTYKNFFTDATSIKTPADTNVPCAYGTPPVARPQCNISGTLSVQCSNNQFP